MGTVHAKSLSENVLERGEQLLEYGDGAQMEEHQPSISKPTIRLNGVRARVDRVHVDGLSRTKDDIIRNTVDDLFHAADFEDVILRAHKVRRALDSMGCFKDIGVSIDVSSGPGSTPEGLEVTFQVVELSRVVGGINTTVSENEGNLVLGVKMPNVLGRGEKIQAEYSLGHRSSSNYSLHCTKPFPHKRASPVVAASVYQQNQEFPWSGYRLLDRGLLLELAFTTSPKTRHVVQWEGCVRDASVLTKNTSFRVRETSGPQMKSVVRHTVSVDHRDEAVFPTRGAFVQFSSEVCGLGGGVAYLKNELKAQHNLPLTEHIVLQVSGGCGVLHDVFGTDIPEHLFLGGATSLRGFQQRGVGPHSDSLAIGGKMYWCTGVHVYAPLPFTSGAGLGGLFRSHLFLNAGCLAAPEEGGAAALSRLGEARAAAGAGVALRLGRGARLELNYCFPLRAARSDRTQPGLQFGLGVHFL